MSEVCPKPSPRFVMRARIALFLATFGLLLPAVVVAQGAVDLSQPERAGRELHQFVVESPEDPALRDLDSQYRRWFQEQRREIHPFTGSGVGTAALVTAPGRAAIIAVVPDPPHERGPRR